MTHADVSPHLITGNSEGARSEEGCSENDGIIVSLIERQLVTRSDIVGIIVHESR